MSELGGGMARIFCRLGQHQHEERGGQGVPGWSGVVFFPLDVRNASIEALPSLPSLSWRRSGAGMMELSRDFLPQPC